MLMDNPVLILSIYMGKSISIQVNFDYMLIENIFLCFHVVVFVRVSTRKCVCVRACVCVCVY